MLVHYARRLQELFPPDEPVSAWLVRLAILRHDLGFEVSRLPLSEDSPPEKVYETTYFMRRLTISLLEAENILNHDLGKLLKASRNDMPKDFARAIESARRAVSASRPQLEAVRDVIGAHLRPKSDASGTSNAINVLRAHTAWTADVTLDLKTSERTNLRDVAMASFFFAWPDVIEDEQLDAKHGEYQDALLGAARETMHATDALLYAFWSDLGIEPASTEET